MKDYYYTPTSLDLKQLLLINGYGRFSTRLLLDKFYYILDHLYLAKVLQKKGVDEYVPLNHKILEGLLTTRHAGKFKKILIELGVIEENPRKFGKVNYLPGEHSKSFKFTAEYSCSEFKGVPMSNLVLMRKIEALREKRNTRQMLDSGGNIHLGKDLIKNSIENLDFDAISARRFIFAKEYTTVSERRFREIIINHFENRIFSFSSKGGRFYHIFTSCPRDIRQFATFKGQPLIEIDVCDCQVALHAILYPSESIEKAKFVRIVSKGEYKSFLNDKFSENFYFDDQLEKKVFKKMEFHRQFYGSNCLPNYGNAYGSDYGSYYAVNFPTREPQFREVLEAEFPELNDLIRKKKNSNFADLPVEMQQIEAGIVIDNVAVKLARLHGNDENFCLISIHDCLITTPQYAEEVKTALVAGFHEVLGFELKVKAETLQNPSPNSLECPENRSNLPFTTLLSAERTEMPGNEEISFAD